MQSQETRAVSRHCTSFTRIAALFSFPSGYIGAAGAKCHSQHYVSDDGLNLI